MKTVYLLAKISRFGNVVDITDVFQSRKEAKEVEKRKNNNRATYEYIVVARRFHADTKTPA